MKKREGGTYYTQNHLYTDILHYYISQCRYSSFLGEINI